MNFKLDGVTLVPEMRKPFDMLVEGLKVSSNRGDRTPVELFTTGAAELDAWIRSHVIESLIAALAS